MSPQRRADLDELTALAAAFPARSRFLAELTLDPPSSTSDLAGPPHLDDDWLVLSTIHSAKGGEWKVVHVIHASDGNIPSDMALSEPEGLEEERRLLYVAMTRAKTDLHVMAPLKYYVASQSRMGDRHVYGAKSRFFTPCVMKHFEPVAFGEVYAAEALVAGKAPVDVATRLRGMW